MTNDTNQTREEQIKDYADFATWVAFNQGDYV